MQGNRVTKISLLSDAVSFWKAGEQSINLFVVFCGSSSVAVVARATAAEAAAARAFQFSWSVSI